MKHSLSILFSVFLFISANAQMPINQLKSLIKADDVEALEAFLDAGNELNACYEIQSASYSILVLSVKYEKEKIFAKCLELKVDLDKACSDKTPLMYAVKYGRKDYFHALLKAGADKTAKSKRGKTAYEYAVKYEQDYFLSYLQ